MGNGKKQKFAKDPAAGVFELNNIQTSPTRETGLRSRILEAL